MLLSHISIFSTLSAAFSTAVAQLTPGVVPQFETLFVATLLFRGENDVLEGPFGTRIHAPITGGSLLDTEGNLVGMFYPGFDTGIVSASGIFFPDAILPFMWTADQKNAYLHVTGVGNLFNTSLLYAHLETDSEAHESLNSRFLLANISFVGEQPTNPTFTIYGAV